MIRERSNVASFFAAKTDLCILTPADLTHTSTDLSAVGRVKEVGSVASKRALAAALPPACSIAATRSGVHLSLVTERTCIETEASVV